MIQILKERDHRGPYLGDGQMGLDAPDLVPGTEFPVIITGTDSPTSVSCHVIHIERGTRYESTVVAGDGLVEARCRVDLPGLYRVEVTGSAMSPVSQLVLVSGE